ncbi:hypothetical protein [Haliangium sp.]|uniref:hypothetical protein n=1 Tax=Haliangium sp. TaxID=2663208 RepID=UPI003D105A66
MPSGAHDRLPLASWPIAFWGVLGFAAIVFRAVWSLTPIAVEPIRAGGLGLGHWALWIGWVVFMVYSEGYKGFQLKVSPRVAARALYAARHPRPVIVLLAPLFCMGLVHATRKRLIVSWCVLTGIVGLVLLVRQLDQPWRGIVDAGVVAGLAWGLITMLWWFARALAGHPMPVPTDVPGDLPNEASAAGNRVSNEVSGEPTTP